MVCIEYVVYCMVCISLCVCGVWEMTQGNVALRGDAKRTKRLQ